MSNELVEKLLSENPAYTKHKSIWRYMLESYSGGETYRRGNHLTKYELETDGSYAARLKATNLDNHCRSVISVYNSFLFREPPTRTFNNLAEDDTTPFLQDADYDGRSLNNFMKDVSTWASVFGHCWTMLVKPNTNANTRADELAQEVRPYINLLTPLSVLDWQWQRQPNGLYVLVYLKYIEDSYGDIVAIKEWTTEFIRSVTISTDKDEIVSDVFEDNGLMKIPAVIAYNQRSATRGIGVSDITDIADAQKFIYNLNSEIEQGIRLESHPSLVKTEDTKAGTGAGSIIHMSEDMDAALKPYMLDFNGASVTSVLAAVDKTVEAIDKMANTGAVRATEVRTLSGVAMQTEFQLLNARLSEKADNLELAEEQIWRLFALYLDKAFDGTIEYPGSFNIQDTQNEFAQLKTAKEASTDPAVLSVVDTKIVELLGEDAEQILNNQ